MKMIIDYSKFQRELVNLSWAESSNELLLNILRDSEVLEGDRNMEEKVSIFPSEINLDAIKHMRTEKKPPLGVIPKKIWEEKIKIERYRDVYHACIRYRDAKLPIPIEWIIELQDIVVEILSSHDIRDPYSLMFKSVFEK